MSLLLDCHSIGDLRAAARRRLPRFVFDYVDKGCEDDVALRANRAALDAIKVVPRMGRDVANRSLAASLFGEPIAMPVVIAPTGAAGLVWHKGEIALARAAQAAGVPFTLATGTMTTIEELAHAVAGRLWFQLYLWPDRTLSNELVARAAAAGYEALVVTLDTPVKPNRESDRRNHFFIPFRPTARNVSDMLLHPRWLATTMLRYLLTEGMPRLAHNPYPSAPAGTPRRDGPSDTVTWDDVKRLRDRWPRKLLVKGILHPGDAREAVLSGADGVIVSNHGGRNVDCAPPAFDALPAVADAVRDQAVVIVDSGVRRGSDVLKAVALGAQAVQVGRATLYGTAVGGQAGAARALALLRMELDTLMANIGCRDMKAVTSECLVRAGDLASLQHAAPSGRDPCGHGPARRPAAMRLTEGG